MADRSPQDYADCFEFKEDDISLTPVWATLPSLPLECWHPNALGKIGSRLGTPIAMDSLTMKMERVSYARILVEVDASKKLVDHVEFILPNGVIRKLPIVYEYTPKFCSACNRFGHFKESCQPSAAIAAATAAPAPNINDAVAKTAEPKMAQPTEWTVVRRRQKANLKQQPPKRNSSLMLLPAAPNRPIRLCSSQPLQQCPDSHARPLLKQNLTQTRLARQTTRTPRHRHSTSCRGLKHQFQHRTSKTENNNLEGTPLPIPMKIEFWNVRGLNRPLKQNGVAHLIKNNRLCLLGILETKLAATAIPKIINRLFPGWCQANNFDAIAGGRILIIWNPAVIDLYPEDISPQVIHCRVTNKSSQLSFYISFTYGLYTVVNRRSMCEKLLELGRPLNMPWIILGDFNCVKSPAKKQLGVPPTWYELKDFADCCLAFGFHDAQTTGCYYTWYSNSDSNPVWCKLDRVLLNNDWLEAGLHCTAHFNQPGCLSDHSPGIVSIFDNPAPKPKPFRFFNMWADHPDFIPTVEGRWGLNVEGTPQFRLCRKLKALKSSLKAFNNLHYSHISARAKEADLALQDAQTHLESNPEDVAVRDSLGDLRKKATFLAEAERHFYFQKAKIHFLKQEDRNTKFFHDMVKRNAARNSILAITKADGSIITSARILPRKSLISTHRSWVPRIRHYRLMTGFFIGGRHSLRSLSRIFVGQSHRQRSKPPSFRLVTKGARPRWSGRMLRQLNHTIIALVPKSEHSPSVADYRPISCCNVIYKVITKIIADRLSPALVQLIDSSQAAFVGGRNITDNIFLAQEMVRQYSRKRISPRCTINVDLRMAFDSVSWTFLSRVLHGGIERLSMDFSRGRKALGKEIRCRRPIPPLYGVFFAFDQEEYDQLRLQLPPEM
ncbi:UNVERIFIED_CONTAM: hypothetical protein Sradi_4881800 [Sesamum radiatum]|uniref:Reverse transcriptase domain-containing protein n=1 Tax=Sesamum radiatum TaxID=300843 RepID=A0AAW2N1B5_SESRA